MHRCLLVLAMALLGCGPRVLWSGRTADRRHRVEVIHDGGLDYLVVDGERRAAYRAIAAWSIAFSVPDRLAFAARVGPGWVVVYQGHWSDDWDSIGGLALSASGRLAFAAERDGGWYVVVDGATGPRFDAILAGTLQYSHDGGHYAYVGESGDGVRAVVDGEVGPEFDGIGQLTFSSDGSRYAYAARRGADAQVVVDGEAGRSWARVDALMFSPSGFHVAFAAFDGRDWRVVVDGEPGPAVDAVDRIVLSEDGGHVAWVARLGDEDVLTLDGSPVAAFPALRDDAVTFRPAGVPGDGPGLTYVEPVTGGERVVVDTTRSPVHDEVGAPVWSRDGRLAFAARDGESWVPVVDDHELPGGTYVTAPVFSPDGLHLGYILRRKNTPYVVVDGKEARFDLVFEDTLTFSADGRRWAIIAGDLHREQLFFALSGGARVPLPASEIYSAAVQSTSPGGDNVLRAWSQAEADRAAADRPCRSGCRARPLDPTPKPRRRSD